MGKPMTTSLEIRLTDLFRATLADDCGNEGYIGIAPDGLGYHVVVPVDRQIARGLKFYEPPSDGTPFGGYSGWRYFHCLTYSSEPKDAKADRASQLRKARENGWLIQKWGAANGIKIVVVEDLR